MSAVFAVGAVAHEEDWESPAGRDVKTSANPLPSRANRLEALVDDG